MRLLRHGARKLIAATLFTCCPAIAPCEIFQTINDPASGISVMVPNGYSAQMVVKKENVIIALTSNDPLAGYCDLSFIRTTVPDRWWRDKTKRDLNERIRTQEIKEENSECIPEPTLRRCQFYGFAILPDGTRLGTPPQGSPVQVKSLQVRLRALFTYVTVKCAAKADEYDKRRQLFEAVIKSIVVPH